MTFLVRVPSLSDSVTNTTGTNAGRVQHKARAVPHGYDGVERSNRGDGAQLRQDPESDWRQHPDADDIHPAAHPVPPADLHDQQRGQVGENVSSVVGNQQRRICVYWDLSNETNV